MSAKYRKVELDLAVARPNPAPIQDAAVPVAFLSVFQLPAGASVLIRFGPSGDDLPLLNQGLYFKACPPESEGVFISNPAGAGILILHVSPEA